MLQYFSKKKGPAPFDTTWAPPAMPKLVEKAKNPVGRPVITPTVITPTVITPTVITPKPTEKAKNPVGRPVITPKPTDKAINPVGRPPKLKKLGKFPEIILNRSHKFSHCVV